MNRLAIIVFGIAVGLLSPRAAQAGLGPENVAVVVYSKSPKSLAVANKFIELRNIPPNNVIYLDILSIDPRDKETMTSRALRIQVLEPVMAELSKRGLTNQISCIAYSAEIPTRVNFKPEMQRYLDSKGIKYNIQLHAHYGSITSLTYFHRDLFAEESSFIELNSNRYYTTRLKNLLGNPFIGNSAKVYAAAVRDFQSSRLNKAIEGFSSLVKENPEQVAARYYLARSLAKANRGAEAMVQLNLCLDNGWSYRNVTKVDSAFVSIRNSKAFQQFLNRLPDFPAGQFPSRYFSSQQFWSENGWPNQSKGQGQPYMLSTVLAVTAHPKQSTLEQALTQLERSASADGSSPDGVFFFAKHNGIRSKIRHKQMDIAANELKSLGFDVEVSSDTAPKNQKLVLGATLGSPRVEWAQSGSQFVPGAFCDNLTSYGAWWAKDQSKVSDFLDAGAAGASGTVYEPYTIPPKFPDPRLHVHYANGCTMAEAYYQSASGPFQLLLVGDPMCCPFGNFPMFDIEGPEPLAFIKDDFKFDIKPTVGSPTAKYFELTFDGRRLRRLEKPQTITMAVSGLSDGYHEIRVTAASDDLVETKSQRRLEFVLNRKGKTTSIETETPKIKTSETLVIQGKSTASNDIEIWQNFRVIGKLRNGKFTIESRKLGLGKTRLQAVAISGDQLIKSVPLEIEVLP